MSNSLFKNHELRLRMDHGQDAHATSINRFSLVTRYATFVFLSAVSLLSGFACLPTYVLAQVNPAPVSLPIEVAHDSVKFVNGDHISGTVKSISNGELSFTLDLAEETLSFRIENVSELTFAGPPQPPPESRDAVYLREGSYLSATVTALRQDAVEAVTPSGQQLVIPKEHIAGIGFHRPNDIVFQSDFSSKAEMGLTSVLGSWDVEKGQLVQASPTAFCRGYVPVVQSGVMRYEWAMELSGTVIGGLCFYASRPESRFGDLSYMVIARGRQLYFNKVIGEARHQGQRKDISQTETLVRFKVEYDSRSGETLICTDGKPLMRFRDPSPLRSGSYVLLHTEGRAVFDDLRITNIVGGIEGLASDPGLDTIILSNGDRVSGRITSISDILTLRSSYVPEETPVPRDRVRSIVFASGDSLPRRRTVISPEITFWNGDHIFGAITSLDELTVVIEMPLIAEVSAPRVNLRSIRFPRGDSSARDTDHTPGALPLIDFNVTDNASNADEEIAVEPR
jgi:hypothetical protein